MFTPRYTITDRLLANITRVHAIIHELNDRKFPHIVLVELENIARAVSAYASTSIEGNPLPLTEVKKILKSQPTNIRDSEKEVLNYNQALKDLHASPDDISIALILTIHKQVMEGLLPTHDVGTFRQQPVVVHDPRSGNIVYMPPNADIIKELLADLLTFVRSNTQKINPLILAGIFHKQMVIIHPFMDGNGRTTRLATKVLLSKMGLNTFNLFSFENYYNKNVTKYFQKVGEYGDYNELASAIDFTLWLEYFTEGIIDELLRVQKSLPKLTAMPSASLAPHHLALLTYIKENGFITDRSYATLTNRAKATRILDLKKLVTLGLIERKGKGRSTYYITRQ